VGGREWQKAVVGFIDSPAFCRLAPDHTLCGD
jgi:hypothetical protein